MKSPIEIEEAVPMLGSMTEKGSSYRPSTDCLQILKMLESELMQEESANRGIRVRIGKSKLVENHLVHILASEQMSEQRIVAHSIRILVKLTLPLECILSFGESEPCSASCVHFGSLQRLLLQYKKAFLVRSPATAALVKLVRLNYAHEANNRLDLSSVEELALVNDSLMLLRNLLHVPDPADFHRFEPFSPSFGPKHPEGSREGSCTASREEWQDVYRKLVWNVLTQGLDSALLSLLSQNRHHLLNAGIVQLISLLFKELHVIQLQNVLQSGRSNADISDDDDDAESDSSSSVQGSSSSICLSSDSSPPSLTPKEKREKNTDSTECHTSPPTLSDSGLSGMGPHGGQQSGSDQTMAHESESGPRNREEKEGVKKQEVKQEMTLDPNKILHNGCEPKVYMYKKDKGVEEKVPPRECADDSCGNHVARNDGEAGKRRNSRELQTSGISHGSSEEDQTRVTRKVIKAHHRSACHWEESDSSDEYNGKPPVAMDHAQNKKTHASHRSMTFLPAIVRSKCCPSVCMEATMYPAAKIVVTSPVKPLSVTAPWDKRKVCGSKNFPLDLNSFVPTNDDVASLLKDFVFMFLHNSFTELILEMKGNMMHRKTELDDSHFFWLIGYFVKLAVSIDLEFHHLEPLLTPELFSLLVYKGVLLNEDIEVAVIRKPNADFRSDDRKIILKKMHLVVSAVRELLYAVLSYIPKQDSGSDRASLQDLRYKLAEMNELRQLFLLYIRSFLPTVHTKQFLVEVITTHHVTMLLLEPIFLDGRFDLPQHLRQFATTQVMDHYGKILQDFKSNTEFVNDCVLTLMHHVAGDLMSPECLFQPIILKTFSLIMESETEIKECWGDLIEYIMIRFLRAAKKSPSTCIRTMFGSIVSDKGLNSSGSSLSTSSDSLLLLPANGLQAVKICSDRDRLYWLYLQFEQTEDPIGLIVDALFDEFNVHIEKKEIMKQLIAKGIIAESELDRFDVMPADDHLKDSPSETVCEVKDAIGSLVEELCKADMRHQVVWVHDFLLKIIAVRSVDEIEGHAPAVHAVPYCSRVFSQPVPLVPFNEHQEMALNCMTFVNFLQELNLILPKGSGKLYPRVPLNLDSKTLTDHCGKIAHYAGHESQYSC